MLIREMKQAGETSFFERFKTEDRANIIIFQVDYR